MEAKAISERWPTTPEQRLMIIERLLRILENPESNPRSVIAASKALMTADAQTLAWARFELEKRQIEGDKPFSLVDIARLMASKLGGGGSGVVGDSPPPLS